MESLRHSIILAAIALLWPTGSALAQQEPEEGPRKRKPAFTAPASTQKTYEFDDCAISITGANVRARCPETRNDRLPGALHRVSTDIEFIGSGSGNGVVHVEASTQRKVKLATAADFLE